MKRTVFRGGTVFDQASRSAGTADVAVEDGWIVDVGSGLDGDEEVDCTGRGVLPGLIDCHVHLIRSSSTKAPSTWRRRSPPASRRSGTRPAPTWACGLVPGPRMQISLNMLSQTGGHGDPWWPSTCVVNLLPPHPGRPPVVVDGPEEIRRKIREVVRAGADVIKVATSGGVVSSGAGPKIPHFRDDEIAMMVIEASAAGLHVMAHAHGEGAKAAVRNGVRSIEHGHFLDDETLAMMAERGTWLVPTLSAGVGLRRAVEAGVPYPDHVVEKIRERADGSVRRAVEAGVRIAMGTDAPLHPHGENLLELELLVEQGLSPADALHAATLSAAELMDLDATLGSLTPGKRADLVVVDGDPLDVRDLGKRILAVYQDGVRRA